MPKRDERPLQLPPLDAITHPEVKAAAEEYANLLAQLRAEWSTYKAGEGGRRQAEAADRDAFAAALRAGKPDPGQKALQEADAAILSSARRIDALQLAVAASRSELGATVERARTEWAAAIEADLGDRAAAFAAAVEAMATAHAATAEGLALRQWLQHMPDRGVWSPGRLLNAFPSLVRRNDEPPTWAELVDAVRSQTEAVHSQATRSTQAPVSAGA